MRLRAAHTSWSQALSPTELEQMIPNRSGHLALATRVYEESMTLVRDEAGNIPLTKVLSDSSTVLVLSPLLMHRASQGARTSTICLHQEAKKAIRQEREALKALPKAGLNKGKKIIKSIRRRNRAWIMSLIDVWLAIRSEDDFHGGCAAEKNLTSWSYESTEGCVKDAYLTSCRVRDDTYVGAIGAEKKVGKKVWSNQKVVAFGQVLHTSYTSHGVREEHEKLIDGADAIIIFVADALRNQHQIAFAKHVAAICKLGVVNNNRPKRLILVSVSSPFDFPAETGWFGTLLCTYDSSVMALHCLARVLGGEITPTGRIPRLGGAARETKPADASHDQTWLVEQLDLAKDRPWLLKFFKEATAEENPDERSPREDLYTLLLSCLENLPRTFEGKQAVDFQGFVIRNTSTRVIYGFASALYWPHLQRGFLGDLLVHPKRRGLSMGRDLCTSVTKSITQRYHVNRIQFGCPILSTTPGVPLPEDPSSLSNLGFFKALRNLLNGWDLALNANTPRLASLRNEHLDSTYDHFVQRVLKSRSSAETFIVERAQSTRCHREILELAGEITGTEAKNYWILSLINRDLSSGNQESMVPEGNLEIFEQSGLIVTMAESGRAVAFLPLVTRGCPLARCIPSLLALPTSKLALLCPIISQSLLPEAHSRKDLLQQLVVAAVGDAMQQRVETLVAHAIPTSDLFAEVLMETGFEREATFAVLDKALGDTWH
ncbi:Beta-hexosaminidase [Fusarium oxysporum f. sp. phaseoli]